MKKIFTILSVFLFVFSVPVFAQSADDDFFGDDSGISDDSSFTASADDDLFGTSDDDFFGDSGIDDFKENKNKKNGDLDHGAVFETGSIKIGGTFSTSLGVMAGLYADDDLKFGDRIKDTVLTPTVNATLTLDARPTQILRMYSKLAFGYPFNTSTSFNASNLSFPTKLDFSKINPADPSTFTLENLGINPDDFTKMFSNLKISDFIKVKELFTDFSVQDRAFFRFGVHTVTWGAGYFFSPVSDMINTSSINPEDTSAQVDGSLNLRTQITFPDSMNCLWIYVVPSTDFITPGSADAYLKDTALAVKGDILINNWELGVGGFYRHEKPLKLMLTATGSIKKLGIFGETVFQLGSEAEWKEQPDWSSKSAIVQFTVGANYIWKDPGIVLAAQYYYDGNHYDKLLSIDKYFISRVTEGHNIALVTNFSKIFGNSDLTATIFGMVNFGKEKMDAETQAEFDKSGISIPIPTLITSAMLSYRPIKDFTISGGPYIVLKDFDSKPTVSLKLTATLGGGKF